MVGPGELASKVENMVYFIQGGRAWPRTRVGQFRINWCRSLGDGRHWTAELNGARSGRFDRVISASSGHR